MEERRREPRTEAQGTVRLWWSTPFPVEVEGQLKDMSASGFRAAHDAAGLQTGQEVHFEHQYAKGRARVVWTRVSAGTIESGFMGLED